MFQNVFTRKTLLIVLLVVAIVESSVIVVYAPPILTRYLYGDFTFGCPVLQSGPPGYNDSLVRWLTLSCPNGPAISLIPSGFTCALFGAHVYYPLCTRMYPTFTAPPGLLGLYLYDHGASGCPFAYPPYPSGRAPLENRTDIGYQYQDHPTELDYCAVVKQSTGTINGFTVNWTAGKGGGGHGNRITASVTNATIAIGNSATLTLRVMNQYNFGVTLDFVKGDTFLTPNYTYTFSNISFNPPTVTVKPDGSNSTTVTVQTSLSQVAGNYEIGLGANPIYGLRFYGDYGGTASYSGTGATVYLKLIS